MVIFHGYVSLPEGNHQKFLDLPHYWDDGDDEDDIFMLPIHWESLTWPDMAMERVLCRFEIIGICRIHWFCGEVVSTKGHHWPFSFMSRIGGVEDWTCWLHDKALRSKEIYNFSIQLTSHSWLYFEWFSHPLGSGFGLAVQLSWFHHLSR